MSKVIFDFLIILFMVTVTEMIAWKVTRGGFYRLTIFQFNGW